MLAVLKCLLKNKIQKNIPVHKNVENISPTDGPQDHHQLMGHLEARCSHERGQDVEQLPLSSPTVAARFKIPHCFATEWCNTFAFTCVHPNLSSPRFKTLHSGFFFPPRNMSSKWIKNQKEQRGRWGRGGQLCSRRS